MNNKKFFSAALSSVFAFALTAGIVTFSSNSSSARSSKLAPTHSKVILPETNAVYSQDTDFEALFSDEVEIGRDEFASNLSSLNSTSLSKSAGLTFSSTRLKGWGASQQNVYVIIDDDNYSGDPADPSLDPENLYPVFNGYTAYVKPTTSTVTVSVYDDNNPQYDERQRLIPNEQYTVLAIPEIMDYEGSFKISNTTIKAGTVFFDGYSQAEYDDASVKSKEKIEAKYPNRILIGDVTTVEEGAFKNVPSFVKIVCTLASKPAGWLDTTPVEFGYVPTVKGNGTYSKNNTDEGKYLTEKIGAYTQTFGKLVKPMCGDGLSATIIDVNWTGDYNNPVRTATGSAPYSLEAQIVASTFNQTKIYIPEKITYGQVEGYVSSIIGSSNFSFPTNDFDKHLYYWVEGDRYIDYQTKYEELKAEELYKYDHFIKLTKSVHYICLEGYKATETSQAVYDLSETQKEAALEKGLTVRTAYKSVYNGVVREIYIPNTINYLPNKSLVNVPDEVTVYVEHPALPETWSSSWTDAKNVVFGAAFPDEKRVLVATDADVEFRMPDTTTAYIVGYNFTESDAAANLKHYCETCHEYIEAEDVATHEHPVKEIPDATPRYQLPIVVEYNIKKADNTIEKVWHEMPLKRDEPTSSSNSHCDQVSDIEESRSFDIILDEGETFLPESVVVHNIFRAKTERIVAKTVVDGQVIEKISPYTAPDTAVRFCSKAFKRYTHEIDLNDVVTMKFSGLTKFLNYSMITVKVSKTKADWSKTYIDDSGRKVTDTGNSYGSYWFNNIDANTYKTAKDKLENGEYSIRYTIADIYNSHYRFKYKVKVDGVETIKTQTIKVDTPNPIFVIGKNTGNQLSFLLKNSDIDPDFKLSNLVSLDLIGLSFNIHAWNNSESSKVNKTELKPHFGAVVIKDELDSNSIFDILTFVIIYLIIFTLAYWAISVALFFFFTNRYKNDEFRRVRPKLYFKNATYGFIGAFIVAVFLIFTIFRFGRFRNGVAVHNPLDVLVIIPGIFSIIVVGYFVKFVAARYKTNKERKRAIKLKLNEDVADDGTN